MKVSSLFLCLILWTQFAVSQSTAASVNDKIVNNLPESVEIIALGDATHQELTATTIRIDLIKKLVTAKGFSIIAIEGNFLELYEAHKDFIQNNDYSIYEKAMYRMLNSTEMEELYTFLYEENKKGNTVKLVGFDPAFSGTTYSKRVENYLQKVPILSLKEQSEFIKYLDKANVTNLTALFRNNKKVKAKILAYSAKIVDKMEPKNGDDYFFLQAMNNLQFLYSKNDLKDKRDIAMAHNVGFLQKTFPNEKILLFGSNTHFIKKPKKIEDAFYQHQRTTTLGNELDKKLGANYYYIAYSSVSGYKFNTYNQKKPILLKKPSVSSIEYKFINDDANAIFVTQETLPLEAPIESTFIGHSPLKLNLWDVMDGMVLLKDTKPTIIK
jgi:erythromycin esterase-like protein